jgi:hypothetical protein
MDSTICFIQTNLDQPDWFPKYLKLYENIVQYILLSLLNHRSFEAYEEQMYCLILLLTSCPCA